MRIIRAVADLSSRDPDRAAGFYRELLDMTLAMSHGWIATLTAPGDESVQLSLMSEDATARVAPAVSIEVADVDEVYERARQMQLRIVHPLTDEPWGVRRFFVEDPDGNVLNILGHGEPASS